MRLSSRLCSVLKRWEHSRHGSRLASVCLTKVLKSTSTSKTHWHTTQLKVCIVKPTLTGGFELRLRLDSDWLWGAGFLRHSVFIKGQRLLISVNNSWLRDETVEGARNRCTSLLSLSFVTPNIQHSTSVNDSSVNLILGSLMTPNEGTCYQDLFGSSTRWRIS